jgi:hypothetical protein
MALAGMHTAMTLWYRLPMFGAGVVLSGARDRAEATRMISEKAAAVFEGAMDAGVEVARLSRAAAAGRLNPDLLAAAPAAILSAGLSPAFRRVRANAKRLHRKSRRG